MTAVQPSTWPLGSESTPVLMVEVEVDPDASPGCAVVHVSGELDLATAPALSLELLTVAKRGYVHLDVDLLGVTFCDGSGLAVLLQIRQRVAEGGGSLLLHDPCPSLRRVLDIFDLTLALESRVPPRPDGSTPAPGVMWPPSARRAG